MSSKQGEHVELTNDAVASLMAGQEASSPKSGNSRASSPMSILRIGTSPRSDDHAGIALRFLQDPNAKPLKSTTNKTTTVTSPPAAAGGASRSKSPTTTTTRLPRHRQRSARLSRFFSNGSLGGFADDDNPVASIQHDIIKHKFSGAYVSKHLKWQNLPDLLPYTPLPAVRSVDAREATTHQNLHDFIVDEFDLTRFGIARRDRVAVILPNGPEAAVCLMSTATYCTIAPINVNLQADEIKFEVTNLKCKLAIIPDVNGPQKLPPTVMQALEGLVTIVTLHPSMAKAGLFTLSPLHEKDELPPASRPTKEPNHKDDIALVLHTSGTSGTKKIVPYPLNNIVVGACCVLASWALTPSDCNLNMMPLFHIGGIARNLFAPILAGGSSIFCPGFDAGLFHDTMAKMGATWYYAAPTMHHLILQEHKARHSDHIHSGPTEHRNLRMIANAAGGLLPALAIELRNTFKATVLPSYGMTECMPISSPPIDYQLDRPGTSGTAVGPELAILNVNGEDVPSGGLGNVCVRGDPLMPGYENNAKANEESFFKNGYFNTGDMGYMDDDGYLYITGRSKEVINRGGEIISPFDVEEACITHPRVKDCLAFSAPHKVLQETIGLVVVPEPNQPRVDLKELQHYVHRSLHPSKWPQVLVFMDETPKNVTGKSLRINLGTRFGLPELQDHVPLRERIYEAKAPSRSTPLQLPIASTKLAINYEDTAKALKALPNVKGVYLATEGDLAGGAGGLVTFITPETIEVETIMSLASTQLHNYMVPDKIIPVPQIPYLDSGHVDLEYLQQAKAAYDATFVKPCSTQMEKDLHAIYQQVLNITDPISVDADFFELGGDSMKTGLLNSLLRKKLNGVTVPISTLYMNGSIELLAVAIAGLKNEAEEHRRVYTAGGTEVDPFAGLSDKGEMPVKNYSSTYPHILLLHLFPLVIVYPFTRMTTFFILVRTIVFLGQYLHMTGPNLHTILLVHLLIALGIALTFHATVVPLMGIAFKWLVIGRFKPGRYPLWGQYYMRWWLVHQTLEVCEKGIFGWNAFFTQAYYRMLGAHIGKHCRIDPDAQISEFDLITIGDNTVLDVCNVRPMHFDKGNLVMKPIIIGDHSSVCCKTTIAAGSYLPPATSLGPNSSSYELADGHQAYRDYNRVNFPSPSLFMRLFLGYPILILYHILCQGPRLGLLAILAYRFGSYLQNNDDFLGFIAWFASSERLAYYAGIRCVRVLFTPFWKLLLIIIIKKLVIGKFRKGARTPWSCFQYWLMKSLAHGGSFHGVTHVVGTHYEIVSMIYRALGAKIGKRVYWPGSGLDIVEYDLLTIGDDVVFGSRSVFIAGDARENQPITIDSGSMVADRCVVLPGVTVKKHAILGSGAIAPKNFDFPAGSTWLGSSNGAATLWSAAENEDVVERMATSTPFGRAFYEHKANFYVMRLWQHIILNSLTKCASVSFWILPLIFSLRIALIFMKGQPENLLVNGYGFPFLFAAFSAMNVLAVMLALTWCITMKWLVIGRRKPGTYRWDESSYCQRWQIMLVLENLRRSGTGHDRSLSYFWGSPYLVWYFRALGSTIGKDCALYPHGGDPLMTEPDLVKMGDGVCVDDASLIAHINTKGDFRLNELVVGKGATLRTHSRLLSGGAMEPHSTLLEHTLVVAGESTDPYSVWQGWPAKLIRYNKPYGADRDLAVAALLNLQEEGEAEGGEGGEGGEKAAAGVSASARADIA